MTYMKIRILVRNSNVKGSVVVMTYLDGNSIPKKKIWMKISYDCCEL